MNEADDIMASTLKRFMDQKFFSISKEEIIIKLDLNNLVSLDSSKLKAYKDKLIGALIAKLDYENNESKSCEYEIKTIWFFFLFLIFK